MPSSRPAVPQARDFVRLALPDLPPLPALTRGEGPPLLLIHGSLCDARYWMPQLPALAREHAVVAPSLRHYYPETPGPGGWPALDWSRDVEDMAALIATLPGGRADVLGHSRGGFIAYHLALRHPERVSRLILAEPGGALPGDPVDHQARRRADLTGLLETGHVETAVQIFVDGVSHPGAWRFSPPPFREMALANAHTLPGQLGDPLPAYDEWQARSLAAPTLLIYGERTRPRFKANVEALAGWIPGALVRGIAGASHGMNLAHPRAFNDTVLEFMAASGAIQ